MPRLRASAAGDANVVSAQRPSDPRRPGAKPGDLTDVEPASKVGRPGFAMAVVAAIVILAVVIFFLVR